MLVLDTYFEEPMRSFRHHYYIVALSLWRERGEERREREERERSAYMHQWRNTTFYTRTPSVVWYGGGTVQNIHLNAGVRVWGLWSVLKWIVPIRTNSI
jgi:hypothetical protein